MVQRVAAEQDDLLRFPVVDQARVRALRRLPIEIQPLPGVRGGGIGPGAGVAALGLHVAAAEQDEAFVVPVVTHRAPQEDAAEFLLRVRLRDEVGPGALGRVVAKGAAASVEDEALGVGVVVVLRSERKGAVDGPVGAAVALGVAEVEALVLPGGGLAGTEARPPVLASGEPVLPAPLRAVEGELVVRARPLAVLTPRGTASEDEEAVYLRCIGERDIPALPGDVASLDVVPDVNG